MFFFSSEGVAGEFEGLAVGAEDHWGGAGGGDGGVLGRDQGGYGRHCCVLTKVPTSICRSPWIQFPEQPEAKM